MEVRGGSRADADGEDVRLSARRASAKSVLSEPAILTHLLLHLHALALLERVRFGSTDSLTLSSIHFWNSSGPRTVTNPRMWA